jgi:uncharacterized YkwD family protein
MNKISKTLATALIVTLLVSVMAVGASAASVTQFGGFGGNGVQLNINGQCPDSALKGNLNGLDVEKLLGSLGLNTSAPKNGAESTAPTQTPCPTSEAPPAVTYPVPQTPNPTPSQTPVKTDAADTDAEAPATEAPESSAPAEEKSCEIGTCPAGDNCTVPGGCGLEDCVSGSCLKDNQACDIGTTFAQNKTLLDQLNAFFAKCGIEFEKAFLYISGCNETPGTETPTPSTPPTDGGETPSTPPVDGGETPSTPPVDEEETPGENGNIDNLSFEEQVAVLVNEQRAANGLAPLTLNAALSNAARAKSQDMHDNKYFSHTSPTYGSPFEMLTAFGISYRSAGENIAMGYSTPEAVMSAWMNSEGHRKNILNPSYTQIGVGYVADGNYWTQEFIG